jgi:hypothetical protein
MVGAAEGKAGDRLTRVRMFTRSWTHRKNGPTCIPVPGSYRCERDEVIRYFGQLTLNAENFSIRSKCDIDLNQILGRVRRTL